MNEQPHQHNAAEPALGPAVWGGTRAEATALGSVISRHCYCAGPDWSTCSVHQMLQDRRALNGLAFARRALRDRLLVEEFGARLLDLARDDPGWAPNVLGPRPAA